MDKEQFDKQMETIKQLTRDIYSYELLRRCHGIKKQFASWLIDHGYKVNTPKNLPSTVQQYLNAIEKVIQWENMDSWEQIIENINRLVNEYDFCGSKAELGKISHNTVISALKRFQEFCTSK